MKLVSSLLLTTAGFFSGWYLPAEGPGNPKLVGEVQRSGREEKVRGKAKDDLLAFILNESSSLSYRITTSTSASEIVKALSERSYLNELEIAPIVDSGPDGVLVELLSDPSASSEICLVIAKEWVRRRPLQALRFFQSRSGYRVDDCLAEILPMAYWAAPDLVLQIIESKPRSWQRRHLRKLVTEVHAIRDPKAAPLPPLPPSVDPFSDFYNDEAEWFHSAIGEDLFPLLADDELREEAQSYLSEDHQKVEVEEADTELQSLDLADYDSGDFEQAKFFSKMLSEAPEEVLAEVIEGGSYDARLQMMVSFVNAFPREEEKWPETFEKLEELIEQLEVIPPSLPRGYPAGPFLTKEIPAQWLETQPLALRRAWSPSIVETWARSDPREALRWAMAQPEEVGLENGIQNGFIIWAHQEPLEAIAFVEGLPEGDLRESAISNAATSWSLVDQAAARAWLDTLPDSPAKVRAIERVEK